MQKSLSDASYRGSQVHHRQPTHAGWMWAVLNSFIAHFWRPREKGAAILLVSVELDEIMSLSDRIGVLYRGEIVGELDATTAIEERWAS